MPFPFVNHSKVLIGCYEKGEVSSLLVQHIQNDLIPTSDKSHAPGGRPEKLKDLLFQQHMSHLNQQQRQQVKQVIMAQDPLFLLEEGELGTLITPPRTNKHCQPSASQSPYV